ncbi:cell division cycle-associated protein 3-like, partial [Centruroides sculpturatus]|uniref:cell division cycle-associated protein 3-like n=1 Tax=Centruroides sculpturatus TaxID=218467 RepID=UPI000C6E0FC9
MGIFNSKEWNDMLEVTNSNPSNSTVTPNKYFIGIDPRSPSEGFDRTPIQVEQTPTCNKEKLTLPALEKIKRESYYHNKENFNLSEDPRSPSINVTRTPIEENPG